MIAVPISRPRRFDAPPAWYGKVPGTGDFVNRRLPSALAAWWERWLQHGMAALRQRAPGELERHYAVAPLWNFAIPVGAGAQCVQFGCLAPSCDRVGRYYPLMVTLAIAANDYDSALIERAGTFYREAGEVLLDAIRLGRTPEQIERALAAVSLPSLDGAGHMERPTDVAPGWPGLTHYFDAYGATSFWWTGEAGAAPLSACAHTGAPNDALFVRLFGAQQSRES